MAKGKKSKKSNPLQPQRTAATKARRVARWKQRREQWANDPAYQAKQVKHQAIIAKAKAKNNGKN